MVCAELSAFLQGPCVVTLPFVLFSLSWVYDRDTAEACNDSH